MKRLTLATLCAVLLFGPSAWAQKDFMESLDAKSREAYRACLNTPSECLLSGVYLTRVKATGADKIAAKECFIRACEIAKDKNACGRVGEMIETGVRDRGVSLQQNILDAIGFYKKACDLGHPKGCQDVKRMEENLKKTKEAQKAMPVS